MSPPRKVLCRPDCLGSGADRNAFDCQLARNLGARGVRCLGLRPAAPGTGSLPRFMAGRPDSRDGSRLSNCFLQDVRLAGAIGFSLAITCVLGVVIHEYLAWYAQASEWQRPYFWHRVGFVILTTVELPLLEIAGGSTVLLWGTTAARFSPNTRSNRYRGVVTESVEDGVTAVTESRNSMTVPEREYPDSV